VYFYESFGILASHLLHILSKKLVASFGKEIQQITDTGSPTTKKIFSSDELLGVRFSKY